MIRKTSKNYAPIKDKVYANLKQDLITGILRPGEFLQEKELADRFGVSKTPIREALTELVKDRFITLLPRKGYHVSLVDPQVVSENLELREILECAAVELAAHRISQEDLDELETLILPQPPIGERSNHHGELESYARTNVRFHQKIATASGNRSLARAMTSVLEDLTRAIFIYYSLPNIELGYDHRAIVEAVRGRDAERARKVMKTHLQATKDRLLGAFLGE